MVLFLRLGLKRKGMRIGGLAAFTRALENGAYWRPRPAGVHSPQASTARRRPQPAGALRPLKNLQQANRSEWVGFLLT
ncbi:hypothetical protein PbJCM17693_58030 [Paenibacillus macerans]|nr:hypothetical protein PbJCM17693_58030 [Paenibacillus macerans]